MTDNIIRRKDKKAWGFTADENGQIKLGVPNTDQTEDVLSGGSEAKGGHNNGGGAFPAEEDVTYELLQSLKKAELLALAKEHEIQLDNPTAKVDELRAELVAYYEVEPAQE